MKNLSQLPPAGTWLSIKEADLYLRQSISWLEKARKDGSGPSWFRVGRNIYYTPESLLEWSEHQIKKGGESL